VFWLTYDDDKNDDINNNVLMIIVFIIVITYKVGHLHKLLAAEVIIPSHRNRTRRIVLN